MRGNDGEWLISAVRHAAGALLSFGICLVADLLLLALDRVLPGGELPAVLLLTALFLAYLACLLLTKFLVRRLQLAGDPRTAAEWLTPVGAAGAFITTVATGPYLLAGWSLDRLLGMVPVYFLAPVLFHIVLQVCDGESAWLMPSARPQPGLAAKPHDRAQPGSQPAVRIRT